MPLLTISLPLKYFHNIQYHCGFGWEVVCLRRPEWLFVWINMWLYKLVITLRGIHWGQHIIQLNQVLLFFPHQTNDGALKFIRRENLPHPKHAGLLNWILLMYLVLYCKQSRNRYIEVGFQSLSRFWETSLMKWRIFQIIFLSHQKI